MLCRQADTERERLRMLPGLREKQRAAERMVSGAKRTRHSSSEGPSELSPSGRRSCSAATAAFRVSLRSCAQACHQRRRTKRAEVTAAWAYKALGKLKPDGSLAAPIQLQNGGMLPRWYFL